MLRGKYWKHTRYVEKIDLNSTPDSYEDFFHMDRIYNEECFLIKFNKIKKNVLFIV